MTERPPDLAAIAGSARGMAATMRFAADLLESAFDRFEAIISRASLDPTMRKAAHRDLTALRGVAVEMRDMAGPDEPGNA